MYSYNEFTYLFFFPFPFPFPFHHMSEITCKENETWGQQGQLSSSYAATCLEINGAFVSSEPAQCITKRT